MGITNLWKFCSLLEESIIEFISNLKVNRLKL